MGGDPPAPGPAGTRGDAGPGAGPTRWWLAQGEDDVPASRAWLSPAERDELDGLRHTKRRLEFLSRRWTAKRAVAQLLGLGAAPAGWASFEIRHHAGGAPWVAVDDRPAPVAVSISDRAGWAVCLVGPARDGHAAPGLDLELVEPRSDAFVGDFLTAAEAAAVRAWPPGDARDEAANLCWSAKEAALKLLAVGLRADTRSVEVRIGRDRRADGWAALTVACERGPGFDGWWRRDGVFLLTLAASRPEPPPQRLPGGRDLALARPRHTWRERPRA